MRALILSATLVLTACSGRPLTQNEILFTQAMAGDQIDPAPVRFHDGHFAGSYITSLPVRPRLTCQERIFAPVSGDEIEVSPGAITLFNDVYYRKDLYIPDYLPNWPKEVHVYAAMLFAHEMTHVWQWQNRARTGYHPIKAAAEHQRSDDPYLFNPDTEGAFLDYGFEQQGAIVEEYVCCQLLDPGAPRTARLEGMIAQAMPIQRLRDVLDVEQVILPWSGAEPEGICR